MDCHASFSGASASFPVLHDGWRMCDALLSLSRKYIIMYFLAFFVFKYFLENLTAYTEEVALILIVALLSKLFWGHQKSTKRNHDPNQILSGDANTTNFEKKHPMLGTQTEQPMPCVSLFKSVLSIQESLSGGSEGSTEKEEINDFDSVWSRRQSTRLKQILICKTKCEYQRYITEVPPGMRSPEQPKTPDPRARVSKRQFNQALFEWRCQLRQFDAQREAVCVHTPILQRRPDDTRTKQVDANKMCIVCGKSGEGTTDNVIRICLAEQLPQVLPYSSSLLTVVNKPGESVSTGDNLLNLVKDQQNISIGPQSPNDKMPPQPLLPEVQICAKNETPIGIVEDNVTGIWAGSTILEHASRKKHWRVVNRSTRPRRVMGM